MDASPTKDEVAKKSKTELAESISSLYENDEHADLTIECGPLVFKVHKAVVYPQSTYFRSACRKGYFKEGQENLNRLEAVSTDSQSDYTGTDDPEAIAHMIHYLYHLEFKARFLSQGALLLCPLLTPIQIKPSLTDIDSNAASWDSPRVHEDDRSLCLHAKVFAAAVKYGIHYLRALSYVYFRNLLSNAASDGVSIAHIATAIPLVYTSTSADARELRYAVAAAILNKSFDLLRHPRITPAIGSVEGLALELLIESSGNTPNARLKPCPKCGHCDLDRVCM